LVFVHDKIQKLREEGPEETTGESDPSVKTIIVDAKEVTAERLNQLLDASEGYLQQYLPPAEDSSETMGREGMKTEMKPVANRALKMTQVAAARMQSKALSKIVDLKRRTEDVVHVDLVKYSEWLDLEGKKETVIITWNKVEEKVVNPAKEQLEKRIEIAKEMAETSTHAVQEKVLSPLKLKLEPIYLPLQDNVVRIWTVVGDQYDQKVVKPRDQIIQMFRAELQEQQEIAKLRNGDEQLTIQAGLAAVVAAARTRLSMEWELRVSPTLDRILGKDQEEEEEEEDKSFGDAEDGEDSE
jgi:hypothetical protein